MKNLIYLTILLVAFSCATYFINLFIIPSCLIFVCIGVLILQPLFEKSTDITQLDTKVKELTNIVNAIRIAQNNRTR